MIDPTIFRAYDIRGVVDETLTETAVYEIARAIGTMAHELRQQRIVVARDGRESSSALCEILIKGLTSTGRDVIDIGMVPTPLLYFATYHLETGSGVMITGSHNAAEYNGLKIMLDGNTLSGEEIKDIQNHTYSADYAVGQGDVWHVDITADYIRRITEDIPAHSGPPLKIVVDCGNGAAGILAPQLLNALGHDVVELYCEIDGKFPNHHPDPSQPENLKDLVDKVKTEGADVGFAFDGDGDRSIFCDNEGKLLSGDKSALLLAKYLLNKNPNSKIVTCLNSGNSIDEIVTNTNS